MEHETQEPETDPSPGRWRVLVPLQNAVALVVFVGLLTGGGTLLLKRRGFSRQKAALEAELAKARSELAAVTRERDEKAAQLAPFEALAAVQVGSAAFHERLPLLLQRLDALATAGARAQGRRHLDAEAVERIRAALKDVPDVDVEVGGVMGDAESMLLARELHSAFSEGRFKLRKVAEYVKPPGDLHGVSIYSKHQLDTVLAGGVAQIFKELAQPKAQWVEEENIAAAKAGDPSPDLKIVVGSQ